MKFNIASEVLSKQLTALNSVIVNNPVIPILENFLFEIGGGQLRVTASDLQTSIVAELPIKTEAAGQIAIPARLLLDTLRSLPAQPLHFTIDENAYSIQIQSSHGEYNLAGENAADFPQVADVQEEMTLSMTGAVLKKAIQQTLVAVSHDELRPAMTGVYIDCSTSGSTFVATDGHRLVRHIRKDLQVPTQRTLVVPRKTLVLLNGLLANDQEPAKLTVGTANIHFRLKHISVISRLIEERYPDYENVIPQNNPHVLTVSRASLLSSLKRVAIYASRTTNHVKLGVADNKLTLSAEDVDFFNKAHEELRCQYEATSLEIVFNAKMFIELLSSLSAQEVVIRFSDAHKAALILPHEQMAAEDTLLLIMPLVLQQMDP
ncbi:MAG: DNA polymerase III subunit beta [Bacteroidota bacterium]